MTVDSTHFRDDRDMPVPLGDTDQRANGSGAVSEGATPGEATPGEATPGEAKAEVEDAFKGAFEDVAMGADARADAASAGRAGVSSAPVVWWQRTDQRDLPGLMRSSLTGEQTTVRLGRGWRFAGQSVLIVAVLVLGYVSYPYIQRARQPAPATGVALMRLQAAAPGAGCAGTSAPMRSSATTPARPGTPATITPPVASTWTPQSPFLLGCVTVTNPSGRRIWDGYVRLHGVGGVGCVNAPVADSTWKIHVLPTETAHLSCAVTSYPVSSGRVVPAHAFAGAWPDHWPALNDVLLVAIDNPAPFRWVAP